MKWLHKHLWRMVGSERLDLSYYQGQRNTMFMITIYKCRCGRVKASATDMQPYLDIKRAFIEGTRE